MVHFAILGSLLLAIPSWSAEKEVKRAVEYSHCNPTGIGSMGVPYRIGNKGAEHGRLTISEMYKKMGTVQEKGNSEFFSYDDPFEFTKGKTTVTMTKENGRPTSVEIDYDANSPIAKGKAFPGAVSGTSAQGVRFGYNDDNCYVDQIYSKNSAGKEMVTYDASLCASLLDLAKKVTAKQLMECRSTFAQMSALIEETKKKFKDTGKSYSATFGMTLLAANDMKSAGPDWESLSALGQCNFNRAEYGMKLDPNASYSLPFVGTGVPDSGATFGGSMGGEIPAK